MRSYLRSNKHIVVSLMVALSCVPLLWNLLRSGFYTSHDGEWMVIRLTAFHQALREGQFPVRWLPRLNHGYGYPVTNFLYPLPFYLAEPFYVLTGEPATAVQIIMGLSVISMAVGMNLFLFSHLTISAKGRPPEALHEGGQPFNHLSFSIPAFVGALAYVYSPYVAYNLYQRGSLGELVAMGIVPWVFWAIRARWWPVASVLLAGLITAHNVVAILFFPIILTYGFILWRLRFINLKSYLLNLTLALSLSASFWVPALAEIRIVRASTINVSDFQNEYLSMTEAFQRSGPVTTVANLGLPLYFLTDSSKGFWEAFKPLQIIQFPWRLLSVFSFTGAVVTSMVMFRLQNRKIIMTIVGVIVVFISIQSSWKFLHPSSFILHPSMYYETNDDTTTVRAEYTPIWVKELPKERLNSPVTHFYPGWRAFLDGKEVALLDPVITNGVLESVVASNRVAYKWSETPLRTFSNLVSIASMVGLLYWDQRRQQEQERDQGRHVRASA